MRLCVVLSLCFACAAVQAKNGKDDKATMKVEQRTCRMKRDYWLYAPETIDKEKTYWLVVGVHGHGGNGNGAARLAGWVNTFDNVIVVGPSFPSKGPYYQVLQGDSDKQLLDIHKDLQKEFKLHDKMFIYGFSGGSQYAHRFAMKHPKSVIGVSSHSGGTWEKGPSSGSKALLWTISCGLKDTQVSAGADAPRIDCFRRFHEGMVRGRVYSYKAFVTPNGHSPGGEVFKATEQCFRAATTGMFDYQREATKDMSVGDREAWLKKDAKNVKDTVFNDGKKEFKIKVNEDGWVVNAIVVADMAKTRKMVDKLSKAK